MEEICIIMGRYAFVTVITLFQKFTIVAKLCFFFNLLYNCEFRYSLKMFKMTMGCKPFIELLSA